MTRVIRWRPVWLALILAALLSIAAVPQQRKSYSADSFDVEVVVQTGGMLDVTETVVFTFVGEPFTFVFRELPLDRTDGITNIRASLDGVPLPEGDGPGQVEIEGRDPVRVTWHFDPTVNTSHTFVLSYRLLGVVQQAEDADVLRFQPLPDEFEYVMESSSVRFEWPFSAELLTEPRVVAGDGITFVEGNSVTFPWNNRQPDQTLVVEMRFPSGALISEPPVWQAQRAAQNAQSPYWITGALLILLSGLAGVVAIWRNARPVQRKITTSSMQYAPPSDLPPAMAGAVNGTDPSWPNALATLFDLADRGVLAIDEQPKKRWQGPDFTILLLQEPKDLMPHEQGLLDAIFETKKGRVDSIEFSKLGSLLSSKQWKRYTEPLKADMQAEGLWRTDGNPARRVLVGAGIVAVFLGLAVLLLTALLLEDVTGLWPLLIFGALTFVGVMALSTSASLKPLTAHGAQVAAEWQAFYKYLQGVTKGRQSVDSPHMFERYLPYAASYGLLSAWAKFFEKAGWSDVPAWFRGLDSTQPVPYGSFVAMTNAANSAGGSAAGGAGAAGGAAGGGASGAG